MVSSNSIKLRYPYQPLVSLHCRTLLFMMLLLDGELLARVPLVLVTDEVRNLLVLLLLLRRLVRLIALLQELLLDVVDA